MHSQRSYPLVLLKQPPARGFPPKETENSWRDLARWSTASARKLIPFALALRLRVLPLHVCLQAGCEFLSVLTELPMEAATEQELRFAAGMDITAESGAKDLQQAIISAYHGDQEQLPAKIAKIQADEKSSISAQMPEPLSSSAPVPQLLEAIIHRAMFLGASDIHLEPQDGEFKLRFRIDGRLQREKDFAVSTQTGDEVLRRIKILSGLDITAVQSPQDGGFTWRFAERALRLRVSLVPTRAGQKVVLRLLDNEEKFLTEARSPAQPFCDLGLNTEQSRLLVANLGATSGGILLSGPTGSGKSTLLYAALDYLNQEWRNIVSLEDPVERLLPGVAQIEVRGELERGFSPLLRAVLRQDPDVIMLGEIRDRETAETALTAAITGHLVLSTVHAGSCFEVLARLSQLGVQAELMALSLRLISSQRLLPLNCPACLEPAAPSPLFQKLFRLHPNEALLASKGCSRCRQSGIYGRLGIFEFLPITPLVRDAMSAAPEALHEKLRSAAQEQGFSSLATRVRDTLLQQKISPATALRCLGMAPELFGYEGKN